MRKNTEPQDAACLRKLYTLSSKVAKAEVESLAGIESETKPQVSGPVANEIESQAVTGKKIPAPLNDRERPSLYTLTKVQQNFSPSGSFQHLSWEAYISMDAENRLRRAGQLLKDAQELVLSGKELKGKDGETKDIKTPKINDLTTLQESLELRASDEFLHGEAEGDPSGRILNEVRRCDRVLHEEILRHISKGVGSLDAGLEWHMDRPEHRVWKLVEQSAEGVPDQGLEKIKVNTDSKADEKEEKPTNPNKRARVRKTSRAKMPDSSGVPPRAEEAAKGEQEKGKGWR